MKRSRFSEEQVIGILREAQAESPVKAVCAAHNISGATYHAWKRKYGAMEVNEALRLSRPNGSDLVRAKSPLMRARVLVGVFPEIRERSLRFPAFFIGHFSPPCAPPTFR